MNNSFFDVVSSFESSYPDGRWSVCKTTVSKREKKEKGEYEAYVCSDQNIGTKTHHFAIALGFDPTTALQNAISSMEAKKAEGSTK